MSNKVSDNQIRLIIYSTIAIGFIIVLGHKTWLNNFHTSQAEKCFKSQNYICAFKHYKQAFDSGIDNEKHVEHYFQTLFKMKKNAVIQEQLNNLYENYSNSIATSDIEIIFNQIKEKVSNEYGDNYVNIAVQGTNIVHWNTTSPINVYIDSSSASVPTFYTEEVKKSFTDYQNASDNKITFNYVNNKDDANIEIIFTNDVSGGKCKDNKCSKVLGLTENKISGSMLLKSTVLLRTKDIDNSEFTANQIHNIAKHEIGHALGINGHSFNQDDIMYPTNNDAEWATDTRTLLIKRKKFSRRDINTIKLLYNIIPDITNKRYKTTKHKDMYLPIAVLGTKEEIGKQKLQEANMYISKVTTNFVAQMGLAESYFANRDFESAKEAFETALMYAQINDEKFTVYHNLAVIYYQNNDYKTALSYAQMANSVSDDIENKNSNEIEAYCYLDLKEYKKAENLLEKLVEKNPQNSTISASLAMVYLKQYKYIKMYNEIKRIKQTNTNAFEDPAYQQLKIFANFV